MTRFVFLSDTHNKHREVTVPDGDVLIHCGDAAVRGEGWELIDFSDWFASQPHRIKIFVPGNHDVLMYDDFKTGADLFPKEVNILTHSAFTVEGVKCFFSSWSPGSYNGSHRWRFHYDRLPVMPKWDEIPRDRELLVTHGPPLGILDLTSPKFGSVNVGCSHLTAKVIQLAEFGQLRYHVFGHIHDSHGRLKLNLEREAVGGVEFINAAICDDNYNAVFQPEVVDYEGIIHRKQRMD